MDLLFIVAATAKSYPLETKTPLPNFRISERGSIYISRSGLFG